MAKQKPKPEFTIEEILDYLNNAKIRATYGAVGEVMGQLARGVGQRLGDRCPRASWVVSSETHQPTGYGDEEKHADLEGDPHVIVSADELRGRLREWKRTLPF